MVASMPFDRNKAGQKILDEKVVGGTLAKGRQMHFAEKILVSMETVLERPELIRSRFDIQEFEEGKKRITKARRQFHPCQGGLEGAEKFFLLPDDRVRRGQLLFQSQAGLRLGEAENALAVQQFDEIKLDFIAVNHNLIVREIRGITTGDGGPSQNDFHLDSRAVVLA
jgi:hypothetical protein